MRENIVKDNAKFRTHFARIFTSHFTDERLQ